MSKMSKVDDKINKREKKQKYQHSTMAQWFKAYVSYFLSNFYFSPNDNPSKAMKNVFYFT